MGKLKFPSTFTSKKRLFGISLALFHFSLSQEPSHMTISKASLGSTNTTIQSHFTQRPRENLFCCMTSPVNT